MRNCPFCQSVFKFPGTHIYACARNNNILLEKKEVKFLYVKYNFPELANKTILEYEYVNNLQSLVDIRKKYKLDFKGIQFLLNYFNIPIRGISESGILISVPKNIKTCMERYGVPNVLSNGTVMKEKRNNTMI
jgi:hypothetical protein